MTARRTVFLFSLVLLLALDLLGGLAQARTYDPAETEFLQLLNSYRAQHGLVALKMSDTLSEAAARHSQDMGRYGFFGHTSVKSSFFPAGSSPWDRMRLTGYTYSATMAENIAAGQTTARQVFDAWRGSSGHNQTMLNAALRVIGVGRRVVAGSPYAVYWTTDFGSVVDPSAKTVTAAGGDPFTDVTRADQELWDAAWYVKNKGYFVGYPSGTLGSWDSMSRRHVALVLRRAGLGSRTDWEQDYQAATRDEVMQAFPGLSWNSGRPDEKVLRSQIVRLLYRAR
ncbi:MAG: CAP domain-containing protein [Thermoleophilia bacterium]|nr:CAP domain-containing protein [Thermoleophilia bacterium]